jgi:hypothetical protein
VFEVNEVPSWDGDTGHGGAAGWLV